ncbi:MAG TPA: hypothetical protein VHZ99_13645 [Steroidobacteraceae bacterium]|jgi:hypothetical protein|nr:hypothetical protein [Steroidobacteraceae bacterium]
MSLAAEYKKQLANIEEQLFSIKRGDSSYSNGQPTASSDKGRLEAQQKDLIQKIRDAEAAGK